jgi:hypothetical protein
MNRLLLAVTILSLLMAGSSLIPHLNTSRKLPVYRGSRSLVMGTNENIRDYYDDHKQMRSHINRNYGHVNNLFKTENLTEHLEDILVLLKLYESGQSFLSGLPDDLAVFDDQGEFKAIKEDEEHQKQIQIKFVNMLRHHLGEDEVKKDWIAQQLKVMSMYRINLIEFYLLLAAYWEFVKYAFTNFL